MLGLMAHADELRLFQTALVACDTPAFIRRARDVELAWDVLFENCRQKREVLLQFPRMRLAMFFALSETWTSIPSSVCRADDVDYLEKLRREWSPRLRIQVAPAKSASEIRRIMTQLASSFQRFNEGWSEYLLEVDLKRINSLREGYNQYYVAEKECAMWSSEVAQQYFEPLPLLTANDLLQTFPLLQIPVIGTAGGLMC
jgi:hypothetical protein